MVMTEPILARHGAPVRIVDEQSSINPHCRAASLHAPLEIFYDLGIVEEILGKIAWGAAA